MDKLEGLLFRLGIYKCQEGYDCIWTAMELVEEDETLLRRLMGGLYAATAARCGNTRTRVERRRQETFFVCCTSICGSKRWKSKHVRRKRLAQGGLKTGFEPPVRALIPPLGQRPPQTGGRTIGWRCKRVCAGGFKNGRNLPCFPLDFAL